MSRVKITFSAVLLAIILIAAGCGQAGKEQPAAEQPVAETPETQGAGSYTAGLAVVTMEMEDGGKVQIELYPDIAPNTVANFISLVQDGFYDGLIFHRVIPGFMIQGGDPLGNGTGGPGYSIKGEFTGNGFKNELLHERGVISMARSKDPDSAGSQFFIMIGDSPHLDGQYAAFGKVVEGMDVVDRIVNVKRRGERPAEDQVIKRMTVDTGGKD